jgi:hypothetical protein
MSSQTCSVSAELSADIQSALEPGALFTEDAYLKALTEASVALTVLEAAQLLEAASRIEFARELKDCLHDALASHNAYRIADVHATAISMLMTARIRHKLPEPAPPGTPLRPRTSTMRLSMTDSLSLSDLKQTKKRPRLSALLGGGNLGKREPTKGTTGGQLWPLGRVTCAVWAMLAGCLIFAISWAASLYWDERRQPILQLKRDRKQNPNMPSLSFCYPVDGFPALVGLSTMPFRFAGHQSYGATSWIYNGAMRSPLFLIRRFSVNSSVSPAGRVSTEILATGTESAKQECRRRLSAFDSRVHRRFNGTTSGRQRKRCRACLRFHGGYTIPGDGIRPNSAVKVELMTDPFADLCFTADTFNFALMKAVAADLQLKVKDLLAAGVINMRGRTPEFGKAGLFFPETQITESSMNLSFDPSVKLYHNMLETMCNVWFFSGLFFPKTNADISYSFVSGMHNFGNSAAGSVHGWVPTLDSRGPYLKLPLFTKDPSETLERGLPMDTSRGLASMSPIEVFVETSTEEDLEGSVPKLSLLPQAKTQIRARIDVDANRKTRVVPLVSASTWIQRPEIGGQSEQFNVYSLDFGFAEDVANVAMITPAINVSQLLVVMMNLFEIFLGLTLFSVFVYVLSLPLRVIE